jgi:hypothetical protein
LIQNRHSNELCAWHYNLHEQRHLCVHFTVQSELAMLLQPCFVLNAVGHVRAAASLGKWMRYSSRLLLAAVAVCVIRVQVCVLCYERESVRC